MMLVIMVIKAAIAVGVPSGTVHYWSSGQGLGDSAWAVGDGQGGGLKREMSANFSS